VRRDLGEPRQQRLDADERRPQGSEIGERWHFNGARTDDENDDVVEIAVIPIATDPRRVGRICVGCGHQREQGSDEEDYAGPLKHAISLPEDSWWSSESRELGGVVASELKIETLPGHADCDLADAGPGVEPCATREAVPIGGKFYLLPVNEHAHRVDRLGVIIDDIMAGRLTARAG